MSNITLNVDDEVIKKVRKIAIDKNTTLTAMVREYLNSVAARDDQRKQESVQKLQKSFQTMSRDMGKRNWSREDLHVR
jgi:ABC-type metal ion transport system substrate-binding protein